MVTVRLDGVQEMIDRIVGMGDTSALSPDAGNSAQEDGKLRLEAGHARRLKRERCPSPGMRHRCIKTVFRRG